MSVIETKHLHQFEVIASLRNPEAAAAALWAYCDKNNLDIPAHYVKLFTPAILRACLRGDVINRGAASAPAASFRSEYNKFYRWRAVKLVRFGQSTLAYCAQRNTYPTRGLKKGGYQWALSQFKRELGQTLTKAFEFSSASLAKTPAFGSPEVIKTSFYEVRRGRKEKFFCLERLAPEVLEVFGLNYEEFNVCTWCPISYFTDIELGKLGHSILN